MTPVWNDQLLGTVGRWGLVLLVLLVLLILSALPFQVVHLGEVRPMFMLMAVYYWSIIRPALLPPPVTFSVGLVLDLLSAYPLGMSALVLVAVQVLTTKQRKFLLGQSFLVIWAGFAILAFCSGAVQWALFALLNQALSPLQPVLISVVLSAFLFPLAALPLAVMHKILADRPSPAP